MILQDAGLRLDLERLCAEYKAAQELGTVDTFLTAPLCRFVLPVEPSDDELIAKLTLRMSDLAVEPSVPEGLKVNGIEYVWQFIAADDAKLLRSKNLGPKRIANTKEKVSALLGKMTESVSKCESLMARAKALTEQASQ